MFYDCAVQVRETFPKGALVINEDLAVYDVTRNGVIHRKRIVPERSWGSWHAESNWDGPSKAYA